MRLTLAKNQSGSTFYLKAQLQATEQEQELIRRYNMGRVLLPGSPVQSLDEFMKKGRQSDFTFVKAAIEAADELKAACAEVKERLTLSQTYSGEEVVDL